ncbi:hypothetical protein L2U69_00815 [Zavarzinia compransoris]|uniref:hypothetical protein n=1 Tax=Zavarzinia marina TaxID=2911065 RepID=UPI001F231C73|nr:hypothetical protein [Zavarzinia marina]MCF4164184.1 hypothetical protein [Zavarzinia marina]
MDDDIHIETFARWAQKSYYLNGHTILMPDFVRSDFFHQISYGRPDYRRILEFILLCRAVVDENTSIVTWCRVDRGSRIARHLGLWKFLKRRGIDIDAFTEKTDCFAEFAEWDCFFGTAAFGSGSIADVADLIADKSAFVVIGHVPSAPILNTLSAVGWSARNLIIPTIVALGGAVASPDGAFDDREQGITVFSPLDGRALIAAPSPEE